LQFKRPKRDISGVLLLDKPIGMTSNAALQQVKRLYQASKAGLTGILDPLASGLLPICLGEATKYAQYPTDADKAYAVVMRLGVTTDTGDSEGKVLTQQTPSVSLRDIEQVLPQFRGDLLQIPPMYSALKHQGQPLYKYARKGIDIERAPRAIRIDQLELVAFAGDDVRLNVRCSKGTYIRVLVEDIGKALECGAHLIELRRTKVGQFDVGNAVTLDQLERGEAEARDSLLRPIDCLVEELPQVALAQDAILYFRQGQPVWQAKLQAQMLYRIYDENHDFIGVGQVDEDGRLAPKRLLTQPQSV